MGRDGGTVLLGIPVGQVLGFDIRVAGVRGPGVVRRVRGCVMTGSGVPREAGRRHGRAVWGGRQRGWVGGCRALRIGRGVVSRRRHRRRKEA